MSWDSQVWSLHLQDVSQLFPERCPRTFFVVSLPRCLFPKQRAKARGIQIHAMPESQPRAPQNMHCMSDILWRQNWHKLALRLCTKTWSNVNNPVEMTLAECTERGAAILQSHTAMQQIPKGHNRTTCIAAELLPKSLWNEGEKERSTRRLSWIHM